MHTDCTRINASGSVRAAGQSQSFVVVLMSRVRGGFFSGLPRPMPTLDGSSFRNAAQTIRMVGFVKQLLTDVLNTPSDSTTGLTADVMGAFKIPAGGLGYILKNWFGFAVFIY